MKRLILKQTRTERKAPACLPKCRAILSGVEGAGRRQEKDWHWAYSVMLAGLFFGLFSLAFAGNKTFVSFAFLSRALAFCCVAGLLVPLRYYRRYLGFNNLEAFLFNVMGTGPLLCSLLLWANFLIRTDVQEEVYDITRKELTASYLDMSVLFGLQDSAFAENPEMRRFGVTSENVQLLNGRSVRFVTAKGILGYRVLVEKQVLME